MSTTQTLITTTAAHIETVQVSIQCVRIGPRQMTQAVFRQLPCEPLCCGFGITGKDDHTYRLWIDPEAEPWGLVNYFWPGCDEDASSHFYESGKGHVHLVYARRGVLYRDCLLYPAVLESIVRQRQHGPGAQLCAHDHVYAELWRQYWEQHIEPLPQLFIAV